MLTSKQPRSGSQLFALRMARGLSREELAAAAGLSTRTIYAIELEGVRPHRATCCVLAMALGCAVADISMPGRDPQ